MTTDEAHSDGHEAPADHIPVPGEDLTRKDYEKAKRSLQIELLEMQRRSAASVYEAGEQPGRLFPRL